MKITRVELRELRLPLVSFFETSFGRTTHRRIVLVRVEADGLTGWGEVTCGEKPFYSYETPETAWHILRDYLIPWSLEGSWGTASDLADRFRPIRGHPMAKAAMENALWDIEAQEKGVSIARLLGGTLEEIPCGVSDRIGFARFAAIPWRRRPWRMRCGILRRRKKAFPLQGFWAGRLKKFPAAFLSEFRRTLRYCSKRSSVNWPQATRGLRSK